MNVFLYIIIFLVGSLFGSLYCMLIYRIPNQIGILHIENYCPKCGKELRFYESIPILSYILLGGKCRKCHKKINLSYLFFEVLIGGLFLVLAQCFKINIENLTIECLIGFLLKILYISCVIVIAGIDKKHKKIEKNVLYYGILVSLLYIIYLYVIGTAEIYKYLLYLVALIILLIIDSIKQKKQALESYFIEMLMFVIVILINTNIFVTFETVIIVFLAIEIVRMIKKIKNYINKSRKETNDLQMTYSLGYLLGVVSILVFIEFLIMV